MNFPRFSAFLAAASLLVVSCDDKYVVEADIAGIAGCEVVMLVEDPASPMGLRVDSLRAESDRVRFEGTVDTLRVAMIAIDDPSRMRMTPNGPIPPAPAQFFVAPGERVRITGKADQMHLARVAGGAMNADMDRLVQGSAAKQLLVDSLLTLITNAQSAGLETPELDSIVEAEYMSLIASYAKFVRQNPDSDLSPFVVQIYLSQVYPFDSIESLYQCLSDRVKETVYGQYLAQNFDEIGGFQEYNGELAPRFSLVDIDGKSVASADFAGGYLLLDFWGSWCKACRAAHPRLVELHGEYAGRGLQVLGVAMNDTDAAIQAALAEQPLPWTQVNAASQPDDIAAMFGVQALPTWILIDPQGNVADIFVAGDARLADVLAAIYR